MIRASVMEREGERGTTVDRKYGGIGLGYRFKGAIYQSGGNGFYYAVDAEFTPDGGAGYLRAVRGG